MNLKKERIYGALANLLTVLQFFAFMAEMLNIGTHQKLWILSLIPIACQAIILCFWVSVAKKKFGSGLDGLTMAGLCLAGAFSSIWHDAKPIWVCGMYLSGLSGLLATSFYRSTLLQILVAFCAFTLLSIGLLSSTLTDVYLILCIPLFTGVYVLLLKIYQK